MYDPSLNFKMCHFTYWVEKHVPVGILTMLQLNLCSQPGASLQWPPFFRPGEHKIHTLTFLQWPPLYNGYFLPSPRWPL